MIFDYFVLMTAPPRTPYYEILDDVVEQAQMVERTGASTIWMSEHHFGGEGYDIQPNPLMTCMHLARYVHEIRIGVAAVILPEWHPLRLAEDIAILDHSLKGRLDIAFAKGITNREISNLSQYEVDRRFPQANEAIFRETLHILKQAWTSEEFSHQGTYYQFPRPGVPDSYAAWIPRQVSGRQPSSEYEVMDVVPKPYQQPHPPLWIVGDSDSTFATGAVEGCRPITWIRSWEAVKQCFETYRREASRVEGRELALGENAGLMRICYVAPTREKAREIAEPGIETLYRGYLGGLRGRDIYAEPGETISDEDLAKPWFEFLHERSHLYVGTPDDVCEQIEKMHDWVGLERLLLFTWLPGMSQEDVLSSMELFGKEVIPNFL